MAARHVSRNLGHCAFHHPFGCGAVSTGNEALWRLTPNGPFEIRTSPRPTPGPGEVVIRVRAVAVNSVDVISGPLRRIVTPWVRYPTVIGSDVAGEVTDVGARVTRLRRGDRVLGFAAGQERLPNTPEGSSFQPENGGFQRYVTVLERVCSPLPDALSFERAAVVPLGIATAAAGLYEADQLGLPLPMQARRQRDDVVLVWGASTSVGCNAVQLARASGFVVVATAGRKNHDLVHSLGAEAVFDYRDADADQKILRSLQHRRLAGTIALGPRSLTQALRVARRAPGSRRIASADRNPLTRPRALAAQARGIRVTSIRGGTPVQSPVGPAIFQDFLPAALADGRFRPAPDPKLFGVGLQQLPEALQALRGGVSAAKIVVSFD